MSDSQESAELPERPSGAAAPEELPPVQPPSAGFIMQLFLIPAIIVAAVIGVWVLFGKLAGAPQDWQQLVQDLGSENDHRRWRAASGLAHMLNSDNQRFKSLATMSDEDRAAMEITTPLATNPEIASELVRLFGRQLDNRSTDDKHVLNQEFLATTLGSLDLPETVLPALQRAIEGEYHLKVRVAAARSVAHVLHRANERGENAASDGLVTALIEATVIDPAAVDANLRDPEHDETPLFRQLSTYALGLTSSEESFQHLESLLSHADEKTRLNAAIAFARHGRTDGFDVFAVTLETSLEKPDQEALKRLRDDERLAARQQYQVEQPMMLNNTIRALSDLVPKLTAKQKVEAVARLRRVAKEYEHPQLRLDAGKLASTLDRSNSP